MKQIKKERLKYALEQQYEHGIVDREQYNLIKGALEMEDSDVDEDNSIGKSDIGYGWVIKLRNTVKTEL